MTSSKLVSIPIWEIMTSIVKKCAAAGGTFFLSSGRLFMAVCLRAFLAQTNRFFFSAHIGNFYKPVSAENFLIYFPITSCQL